MVELFKKIDINNDNAVSFQEFVVVAMERDQLHSEAKLKATFDMMDKDGDNNISPEELLDVFSFNKNFNLEMAKEMIHKADFNNDGHL